MPLDPSGETIIATQWTLIFIATGVIVARLYLRLILQKRRLLISDLFMCAGWCSAVALASFDIVFYRMGVLRQGVTLGLVGFEGTAEEAERFYKLNYIANYPFFTTFYLAKAALLAVYHQVFPTFMVKRRRFLWATVIYVALSFVISMLLLSVTCLPIWRNCLYATFLLGLINIIFSLVRFAQIEEYGKDLVITVALIARQSSENLVLNLGDSHGGLARAVVALDGKDLVVVVSEVKTNVLPGLEVSTGADGTAGALAATDGPELLEGLVALDGRSVGTGADVDVVDGTIDGDLTLLAGAGRGVVGAEALNDVVLNQRVAGPAVDGKVAVAVGLSGWDILPGSTLAPSLSTDVVTVSAPLHAELASVAVGIGDGAGSIGPEGVVVAIVVASGGVGALGEADVLLSVGSGSGHDASESRDGGEKVGEGNHFERLLR
ncbi:hypothetical protein HG530_014968 [Fusarium avenaceum]|nr:hypothetical protein HG530_014968 [Fusarium avenaceum]